MKPGMLLKANFIVEVEKPIGLALPELPEELGVCEIVRSPIVVVIGTVVKLLTS